MPRAHGLATVGWSVLAAGASAGFVARDLLGLSGAAVALAWIAGAAAGAAAAGRALRATAPAARRSTKRTAGRSAGRGAGRPAGPSAGRPTEH